MKTAIVKDRYGNFAIYARYQRGTSWYLTVSTKESAIHECAQLRFYQKQNNAR